MISEHRHVIKPNLIPARVRRSGVLALMVDLKRNGKEVVWFCVGNGVFSLLKKTGFARLRAVFETCILGWSHPLRVPFICPAHHKSDSACMNTVILWMYK